jgi:rare lipoprotein A
MLRSSYFPEVNNSLSRIIACLLLLSFLLLNGCSTARKDGPPSYDVDVSRIPNAVPKVEPLSRTGNKPYTVRGKRYYVMNSSKNYRERGIASWYGTKFHGHYASNGERYNMLAMTAAHKNLPLPTYVTVTNLKNNREVIVKVTDRGPFENNRLIDLSYAAAKKLGMLGHGTAPVEVRALDPLQYDKNYQYSNNFYLAENMRNQVIHAKSYKPEYQTHSTTYASARPTYIQVGAFKNRLYAEKLKHRLSSVVSSPVNIAQLTHRSKLYRVQIGPVRSTVTLAQINRQLRIMGISGKTISA